MNETEELFEKTIFVRDYSQTYIARLFGKTASCTASREAAAKAVCEKVLQDYHYKLEMIGNGVWKVIYYRKKGGN
jgi:hypothetical protein